MKNIILDPGFGFGKTLKEILGAIKIPGIGNLFDFGNYSPINQLLVGVSGIGVLFLFLVKHPIQYD